MSELTAVEVLIEYNELQNAEQQRLNATGRFRQTQSTVQK